MNQQLTGSSISLIHWFSKCIWSTHVPRLKARDEWGIHNIVPDLKKLKTQWKIIKADHHTRKNEIGALGELQVKGCGSSEGEQRLSTKGRCGCVKADACDEQWTEEHPSGLQGVCPMPHFTSERMPTADTHLRLCKGLRNLGGQPLPAPLGFCISPLEFEPALTLQHCQHVTPLYKASILQAQLITP